MVQSSFLVSVLFREAFSHPYISFFSFTSKRFLCYYFPYFFRRSLPFLILMGSTGGRGAIIMASASTPSANEPAKDLSLVHTVQLKPMIKSQISGRMLSSG